MNATDRLAEIQDRAAKALAGSVDVDWLIAEVETLRTQLATAERQNRQLDEALGETVDDRDHFHDMADKLAYAVAPEEVIGEHSSMNCPWVNALDLITPMAEVDKLRTENAGYEKCFAPDGRAA